MEKLGPVLPREGLCLLLPGTSARKGIPALAPWKQSSWECQIRYWAWAEQWGTQGSPGESACPALGSASSSPPAPSAPSIEHRASGLRPSESAQPSGVFTGPLARPNQPPEQGRGGGRQVCRPLRPGKGNKLALGLDLETRPDPGHFTGPSRGLRGPE